MQDSKYVLGIDFGTDSVRALLVDALTGKEISDAVECYPRWEKGLYCDPAKSQYRQHPLDYTESMEAAIKKSLSIAGKNVSENVVGIAVDTTGSTPVFTDEKGTPLALNPEFAEDPDAMFILWKDHTAIKEAEEINVAAEKSKVNYVRYEGGIYSSEWVWAKVLHVLRNDKKVRDAAWSWIEHCDWIPAILTGRTKPLEVLRSRCSSGHKAMWHEEWKGLPPREFLNSIDPLLTKFDGKLFDKTYTSDVSVGNLTVEWAGRLGLSNKVIVGVGAFDCHMGAVGGDISPNVLVRVMGTSTCDILISSYEEMGNKLVKGICGQVDGSVVPGFVGLEAGQSAFGDVYAWFRNLLSWPLVNMISKSKIVDDKTIQSLINETIDDIVPVLSEEAAKIPISEWTLIATDWFNGRRTPDANQNLTATISGLHLGSSAPHVFRALVEATAYGSKAIVDRFIEEGVKINEIIAIGGVARKSPFVMQTLANVLNMKIKVALSDQACALGAAMFAATAAGLYSNVIEAQKVMKQGIEKEYVPQKDTVEFYKEGYKKYIKLGKNTSLQ
jgi:L-ribulokinase